MSCSAALAATTPEYEHPRCSYLNPSRSAAGQIWATSRSEDEEEKEEKPVKVRYRLRTVLLDYIKVGCKIVRQANRLFQKFGKNCHNFLVMKEIYARC